MDINCRERLSGITSPGAEPDSLSPQALILSLQQVVFFISRSAERDAAPSVKRLAMRKTAKRLAKMVWDFFISAGFDMGRK